MKGRAADACAAVRSGVRLARAFAETLYTGLARTRMKGLGLEYIDFRDYTPEDDVRYVDWRLSARSLGPDGEIRLIVKVFQAERMVEAVLAVDLTESMGFGEKPWVLAYTATIISALAASLEDKLTLAILADSVRLYRPRSPRETPALLEATACREGPRGRTGLEELAKKLHWLRNRPVVLITDYAHTRGELAGFLREMRLRGNPTLLILVADPYELNPPLGEALVRLVGVKHGEAVTGKISTIYEAVRRHVAGLRATAKLYSHNFLELRGKTEAKLNRYRLVESYLYTRSSIKPSIH